MTALISGLGWQGAAWLCLGAGCAVVLACCGLAAVVIGVRGWWRRGSERLARIERLAEADDHPVMRPADWHAHQAGPFTPPGESECPWCVRPEGRFLQPADRCTCGHACGAPNCLYDIKERLYG